MTRLETEPGHLFCFGLGFSAGALARQLADEGWRVSGTCRGTDNPSQSSAYRMHVFDGSGPIKVDTPLFSDVTHVLSSVPPGPDGDPVLAHYGRALAEAEGLQWIGYLSTTGVYGNTNGAVVDETAPLNPTSKRSTYRAQAETAWLDLWRNHGLPVHAFRLAGIYGPGRNVFAQVRERRARRIDKPGHRFSRIHVDDIAAVLRASIDNPNPGAIYNVCDDEPVPPATVVEFACELLGDEPPPLIAFEDAAETMSPMALTFWNDNRRVDNRRIKEELGVELAFPTYREGLQGILDGEGASGTKP